MRLKSEYCVYTENNYAPSFSRSLIIVVNMNIINLVFSFRHAHSNKHTASISDEHKTTKINNLLILILCIFIFLMPCGYKWRMVDGVMTVVRDTRRMPMVVALRNKKGLQPQTKRMTWKCAHMYIVQYTHTHIRYILVHTSMHTFLCKTDIYYIFSFIVYLLLPCLPYI